MEINIILLIAGILLLIKILDGYKRGMVKELISLVTLTLMCVVVVILAAGLHFVEANEIAGILVMVLLLVLLGIAHHFLRLIFFSANLISKLPVISFGNKLLGMVVGALEVLFLLWTVYTFTLYYDLGMIGELIIEGTRDSVILSKIYEFNLLAPIVESVIEQLPW